MCRIPVVTRWSTIADSPRGNFVMRRAYIPSLLFLSVLAAVPEAAAAEPDTFPLADRFSHYLHRTYSWQRMAWLGLDAGLDYSTGGMPGVEDLFRGYGDGFGRR